MDLVDHIRIKLKRWDTPESTHTFGLFRFLFFAHVLRIAMDILRNQDMLFYPLLTDEALKLPVEVIFMLWATTTFCMMIGLFVRYTSIAHYILTVVACQLLVSLKTASFYNDLMLMGALLSIVFPVGRSFSVDNLIRSYYNRSLPQTTGKYTYLIFIFLTLGLLYFASALTKLTSKMWLTGLGVWLPLNFPLYTYTDFFQSFMDQKLLMYALNYLVLAWEILFVILLFFKQTRWLIALVGIGFHSAIGFIYPFSYISFGPVLFYVLFIPTTFWKHLFARINKPFVTITPEQIEHLNLSGYLPLTRDDRQNLLIVFALVMLTAQLYVVGLYTGDNLQNFHKATFVQGYERTPSDKSPTAKPFNLGRALFGLSSRGLFVDGHFKHYIPAFAISYLDKNGNRGWIPLVNTRGHTNPEISNYLMWHRYAFAYFMNYNGEIREEVIKRFTAHWATSQHIPLDGLRMRLLTRQYKYSYEFKPGLRKELENTPWTTAATMEWEDSVFTLHTPYPVVKH